MEHYLIIKIIKHGIQFYMRIKGSPEDIASEGLTYSLSARQALNKIIQVDSGLIFEDINYSTQNVGAKLERPDISEIDKNGKEVSLNNQKLIVKTWNEILQAIRLQLVQANEQTLLSDIDQVIGLCETIDNNSFQPYQNENFSPNIAKKINSYYDLADKVIDELKKRGLADTNYLNAAPQKYGYTRYFKMGTMGLSLNVRFDFWEKIADTPFWLCLKDDTSDGKNWKQTEPFKSKIKNTVVKNSVIPYESNKRELFIPVISPKSRQKQKRKKTKL